ncbi:MAG: formylglycine-generating enzyme family protein, partial [Nitrospiraceae bacterium]
MHSFALTLVVCFGSSAEADHEKPSQALWASPFARERLAAMEAPEGMVAVPAGWFLMGSDPAFDRDAGPQEQPQRWVYLDGFRIDRFEVTNVHYLRFVLATGAFWPPYWKENPFPEKIAAHPVIGA